MNTTSPFVRRVLLGLALPVLALTAGACSQPGDTVASGPSFSVESPAPGATSTPAPAPDDGGPGTTDPEASPSAHETIAAQITKPAVKVHRDPADAAKVVTTLGPATSLGSKTTLLVLDQRDGWVHVSLPIRPNGSTGWVKIEDVELRTNPMAVTVNLAAHTLTLTHDGDEVLTTPVAIGSKANPTPAGHFFVTDLIDTDSPTSAYGPFAFGLSGHSDTLTEFGGGDGQLGIHGTDDPSSIGKSVSHGCVRVPNDVIEQLSELVPLGTPVTIA
jgi:lipoprotein-anchoring transpeptidase ErfK/SrfK